MTLEQQPDGSHLDEHGNRYRFYWMPTGRILRVAWLQGKRLPRFWLYDPHTVDVDE